MNNVKRNLGLPVSGDVIDLPAYDVNDMTQATPVQIPSQRPMSFVERLKAAGRVLSNPAPTAAAPLRYETNTAAPAPITSAAVASNPPPVNNATAPTQQANTITPGANDLHYHPVGMQPTEDASQEKPAEVPQGEFFRERTGG